MSDGSTVRLCPKCSAPLALEVSAASARARRLVRTTCAQCTSTVIVRLDDASNARAPTVSPSVGAVAVGGAVTLAAAPASSTPSPAPAPAAPPAPVPVPALAARVPLGSAPAEVSFVVDDEGQGLTARVVVGLVGMVVVIVLLVVFFHGRG